MSSQPSPPPTFLLILFLVLLPSPASPSILRPPSPTAVAEADEGQQGAETAPPVADGGRAMDPPPPKALPQAASLNGSDLFTDEFVTFSPGVDDGERAVASPDPRPDPSVSSSLSAAATAAEDPAPLPPSLPPYSESLDEDVVDVEGPHHRDGEGFDAVDENGSYYRNPNCTNDYCISDEDYHVMIENHVWPTGYEWFLIALHAVVFAVGLVGNALVCAAVRRNHSMRTVTNYFIVNLAVADFMVILFCLPPTVAWDVTETWFMGTALCKVVLYFQTVSVAVSVLTLTFISVDRWYAICFPLKFKSTTGRAKTAILVIWFVALCFDIPELVVLKAQPKDLHIETILLTQCMPSWSVTSEMTFTVAKSILLYTVPLIFMSFTYYQIVRVLWKSANIPGHTEARAAAAALAASSASSASHGCTCSSAGSAAIRCCFHQGGHCSGRQQSSNNGRGMSGASSSSRHTTSSVGGTVLMTNTNVSTEGQLRSRRKAAKMLVAVVLMFAVCYFPVHLLGIMRYMVKLPQTDEWVALSMISHWLCYANSAVNPVIYNFMSGKFRKEFRRTFCFWWRHRPRDRAQVGRRVNGSLMDKTTRLTKGGWRFTGWLKGRQRGGHSARNASTTTGHSRGSSYYKSLFRSTLRHNANGQRSAMATEYEDFEVGSSYTATARTEVLPLSRLGSATIMVVDVD